MIYQFKVQLQGFRPPIWRRLQVHSNLTFYQFHQILQVAFDWLDYHLHSYQMTRSDGKKIDIEIGEEYDDFPIWHEMVDEHEVQLKDFFMKEKDRAVYTYDFGDDWRHEIVLEKILEPVQGQVYPFCVKAMREAPEEDSRGMYLDGISPEKTMDSRLLTEYVNEELEQFHNNIQSAPTENSQNIDWVTLLSEAKAFNQLAPWTFLESDEIYIVVDPITEEKLFCSILGEAGEVYGMAVYIGKEGFASLQQIFAGKGTYHFDYVLNQRAILISFVDRDELEKPDYEVIKASGVTFRGRKQWPEFRSYVPGLYPWFIIPEEARLIALAMEQIKALTDDMERVDPSLISEKNKLARIPKKNPDGTISWITTFLSLNELGYDNYGEEYPLFIPELDVKRLSKSDVAPTKIEFDCFHVNMPVQDHEGERPYFPLMAIALDQQSGIVIFQEMMRFDRVAENCQQAFVNFIQQLGAIPSDLFVTSSVFDYLYPVAMHLPRMSLHEVEILPAVSEFKQVFAELQR